MKKTLARVLAPPPRLTISEWADRFAYIPEEGNAEPGKYRLARIPYQRAMLDDPLDPTVTDIVWKIGAQLGKTLCFILIVEYFIDQQPSAILVVYPTLDSAKSWMREKFIPATKATPRLRGKLKEPRARDSESTTLNRKFPGGNLTALGANSTSGLRQRSKRVIMQDEIDDYEVTKQGDPCAQADMRAETFHNAVRMKSSTCTKKGASRIETLFEKSDKQRFYCPCPRCGEFQVLDFWQVKWPKLETETGKIVWDSPNGPHKHLTEQAIYECAKCHAHLQDSDRFWMIDRGEWRADAPGGRIRGRELSGMYQVLGKKDAFVSYLHEFAERFLAAKKAGPAELEVWTNLFLNQTWEEAGERIEASTLLSRVESYTPQTLPNEIVLVVAGGDVQDDRIEVEFQGIGADEETWGIEVIKVMGSTLQPSTWENLTRAVDRIYKRADGIELRPTAIALDIHFRPKMARGWCARHGTRLIVYPVLGASRTQPFLVAEHFNPTYQQRTWSIATNQAKDLLLARLKLPPGGPRSCHFPHGQGYTDDWFRQLTSERAITKYIRGFGKRVYEKQPGARNEAVDMRVYALGCLDILRPNIPAIAESLKPKPKEPNKPPPQQSRFSIAGPRRSGWVTGYK